MFNKTIRIPDLEFVFEYQRSTKCPKEWIGKIGFLKNGVREGYWVERVESTKSISIENELLDEDIIITKTGYYKNGVMDNPNFDEIVAKGEASINSFHFKSMLREAKVYSEMLYSIPMSGYSRLYFGKNDVVDAFLINGDMIDGLITYNGIIHSLCSNEINAKFLSLFTGEDNGWHYDETINKETFKDLSFIDHQGYCFVNSHFPDMLPILPYSEKAIYIYSTAGIGDQIIRIVANTKEQQRIRNDYIEALEREEFQREGKWIYNKYYSIIFDNSNGNTLNIFIYKAELEKAKKYHSSI